ncbi:MAG TPA: GNAT family N-acetyltransferase [Schlesneria sp.]
MQAVDVSVHYLEMFCPPSQEIAAPRTGLAVAYRPMPSLEYYRTLYSLVGEEYRWLSRRKLTDAELASIIHDPLDEFHVLQVADVDAGIAELDFRHPGQIEIVQFGLLPGYIGQGLGKWFLDQIVQYCWSRGPDRVWLHTCTFDHPAALPNYQRAGFCLYKTEIIRREY